jgi:hypothetical protein
MEKFQCVAEFANAAVLQLPCWFYRISGIYDIQAHKSVKSSINHFGTTKLLTRSITHLVLTGCTGVQTIALCFVQIIYFLVLPHSLYMKMPWQRLLQNLLYDIVKCYIKESYLLAIQTFVRVMFIYILPRHILWSHIFCDWVCAAQGGGGGGMLICIPATGAPCDCCIFIQSMREGPLKDKDGKQHNAYALFKWHLDHWHCTILFVCLGFKKNNICNICCSEVCHLGQGYKEICNSKFPNVSKSYSFFWQRWRVEMRCLSVRGSCSVGMQCLLDPTVLILQCYCQHNWL